MARRPRAALQDETLVHCSIEEQENYNLKFPVNLCDQECMVYAKTRPYMREFLEAVSKCFEVVLFTASQKVYANELLNILDPKQELIK